MCHVRDVDADLHHVVGQLPDMDRVVQVPRSGGVDRVDPYVFFGTQVVARSTFLFPVEIRLEVRDDRLGLIDGGLGERL